MREIFRSLKIRLSILAISVTCGCAFNFGQVNASGTVNASANADTKIENNVDTTINASASVTQNGGDGSQQTASPVPSATPTTAPKGRLTVLQNFQSLDFYGGEMPLSFSKNPFFSIFLTAKERNITITEITFTRIGRGVTNDDALRDIRLAFSTIGVVQSLSSLKNGNAHFSNINGLATLPKDLPVELTMGGSGIYPHDDEQTLANYSKVKTIGFALKKTSDIRTDVPVEIIGSFPFDGPTFHFCCYGGNLTPND